MGEEDFVALREQGGIKLSASDDEDLASVVRRHDFQRVPENPSAVERGGPREHPVLPPRERLAERLECLSSHHDDMAERRPLEKFQVAGEVPRNFSSGPDHALPRHGGYRNHKKSVPAEY